MFAKAWEVKLALSTNMFASLNLSFHVGFLPPKSTTLFLSFFNAVYSVGSLLHVSSDYIQHKYRYPALPPWGDIFDMWHCVTQLCLTFLRLCSHRIAFHADIPTRKGNCQPTHPKPMFLTEVWLGGRNMGLGWGGWAVSHRPKLIPRSHPVLNEHLYDFRSQFWLGRFRDFVTQKSRLVGKPKLC